MDMIPLDKAIMTKEMLDAAADALSAEDYLFGESVAKFEEEFATFIGTDYAVSLNSGTDALAFILMAIGVKGKKVITTPSSFIATANSAFHAGGKPVFSDIDPITNNLDPNGVKRTLAKNKKTGAILPVHLHGYPADMEAIMDIAIKTKVPVIEDACQAHGGKVNGKRVGSIGDAAAFSFNPFKNMTVGGDGGMVTTDDKRIADMVRMLADSGRANPYTHEHEIIGFTSRLNTVKAAIGRVQLRYLDDWNGSRQRIAAAYTAKLVGINGLRLPSLGGGSGILPVFNKYAVKLKDRDGLKKHLLENSVYCDSHYPIPIHLQPPYRRMGYKKGDFPVAERFADTTLSLPMFVEMKKDEMDEVCGLVSGYLAQKKVKT
jgi:perosamine synthetase